MENPCDLRGKVALVTGGGSGIGAAVSLALAKAGAFIGVHYHSSSGKAEETLAAIRAYSDGMLLQGDLTEEADANAVVDQLAAKAGRLDILVNNAGALVERATIAQTTRQLWDQTFAVNVTSAFMVTRRAIDLLKKSGSGRIINITSLSTQTGGANGAGAYAASKGALQVFTRTLARELAPEVRANAICPGVIETQHHEKASSPERMAFYRKDTPLARNGAAEEVAQAVLYLASDASSFVNGALLDVNGGRFLR